MLSLHEENKKNGKLSSRYSVENDRVSTYFQHKAIHKGTWTATDVHIINQIDHVIANTKKNSIIQDVRVIGRPNCDSDHFLVTVMIEQKLIFNKEQRMVQKTEIREENAINDPEVPEKYTESTCNKLTALKLKSEKKKSGMTLNGQ